MAEKEPVSLDRPVLFDAKELAEVTGYEEGFKTIDDFKGYFEQIKNREPEKVVEKEPFNFKDSFIENAVKYYESHGNLNDYLQANQDFTSYSPEDLIRLEISRSNEGLSANAIDHLYKKEMSQYSVTDEMDEGEKALRQELLNKRGEKLGSRFSEEYKKLLPPEEPSVDIEKWGKQVKEAASQVVKDGKISFKYGEDEFNYEVGDSKPMVEMTIDNTGFFKQFYDEKGTFNHDKWFKVLAYAQNQEGFESALINHGKSMGTESVVKDVKNAQLEKSNIQGADKGGLLQAFVNNGKAV